MWSNEYTAVSPLPARAIWDALKALHEGRLTYEGSDTFVLHGPFAKGTRVSVTPVGQDTFESTIVDLVDNVTYADETSFGGTKLLFRHTLTPVEGGTQVAHRLEISGPSAADFDVSMAKLFERAKEFEHLG
jgi:hypothetical protein